MVTTVGRFTEPLWAETGAVATADVDDTDAFASTVFSLLKRDDARQALAARGQQVYAERFSVMQVVHALRAA